MKIEESIPSRKILLVGNPNVGKSVIFRLLTGSYVLVSNFPGTTVEITRGRLQLGGQSYEVIDTPGVNSLVPQSEDELVTCEMLIREQADLILQVADAKNLRRTLLITSQLVEFRSPTILVLNMMDEAEERGISIDAAGLASLFSMQVVETTAIYSRGRRQLLQAIQNATLPSNPLGNRFNGLFASYPASQAIPPMIGVEWLSLNDRGLAQQVEAAIGPVAASQLSEIREKYQTTHHRMLVREIEESRNAFLEESTARLKSKRRSGVIGKDEPRSSRVWIALLLCGLFLFAWNEFGGLLNLTTPLAAATQYFESGLKTLVAASPSSSGRDFAESVLLGTPAGGKYQFGLLQEALHFAMILAPVILPLAMLLGRSRKFAYELGILTRRPATGIPILILVLILVFEFVGYTGAQTLVGLLEKNVFARFVNPFVASILPSGIVRDFIAGKYGVLSMGLTYAIAIVLPVVATFFIAFGLLEDSGYLPRLSILTDRVMRLMGLNGKATLPMILGLGCCTMASMTTRILNSRKERMIATLLLALGVPCSAQLGVILGISAAFSYKATLTVIGVVASQLLLVGYLASKLIRGQRSEFIFEIPPIRVPQMKNVLLKTGYRIRWYMMEAVPLFIYGTIFLFVLDALHVRHRSLLGWIEIGLAPVLTGILHLPSQAAGVFVLGFLRRDYGAAGLFAMVKSGQLDGPQTVVSMIVITLFVPCVATFLMIIKEQGMKRALGITGFIIPFAVCVGGVVSWIFGALNITFR